MLHLLLLLPLIGLKADVRWKRLSKTKDLLIHYSNSLLLNTSLIMMKASVESKVFCCSEIVSKVSEVFLWFSFTTSYSSHLLSSYDFIPLSKVALMICMFIIFAILVFIFIFSYLFILLLKFFFCLILIWVLIN